MEKLKNIPRSYFDDTVHEWVKHVLTLMNGIIVNSGRHQCGFCHYVRENADSDCRLCPAFGPCSADEDYWRLFVEACLKENLEDCLETALCVLEWLYDFEQAGNVK